MRAIRVRAFGGPEVLRLEDVPDPKPGPGQVLVRVKAAGVNPVETYVRSGTYARVPELPYTPGADAAGTVEAVGEGVRIFSPGERVYAAGTLTGSYAELALCEASRVHPLPSEASFEQGAALGVPYATAYQALFHRAKARPGETLLVHGASGGVGTAAVQLARAAGLRIVGTAGTDSGRRLALAQGAHAALDHASPDHAKEALEASGGKGFDVVLEMLANQNLALDLTLLTTSGRVVVVGSRGRIELDPREAMRRDAAVLGMTLFNATDAELRAIHAALAAGLENGTLKPVVGRRFPLAEAPKAHEAVMAAGSHGKIVLLP